MFGIKLSLRFLQRFVNRTGADLFFLGGGGGGGGAKDYNAYHERETPTSLIQSGVRSGPV